MYTIKEIFYTLQGEGTNAGRAAVFCRFSGCNLWSGREADREKAVCTFCDTDFVGTNPDGGRFATASDLADAVRSHWPGSDNSAVPNQKESAARPLVVCTGGEPLLQLDEAAVEAFHDRGFEVAVETNGTISPPSGVDHICVSPKANAPLLVRGGQELKLVYPQAALTAQPECFVELPFAQFFLQPMDGPTRERNIQKAIEYCLSHPRWRLSLQTHKLTGLR